MMKKHMYNPQLFENRSSLLQAFLELNELERRRQLAAAGQDFHLMKSLTLEINKLKADIDSLTVKQQKLEAELQVATVFGELSEFIMPKTEPAICKSDVFQRILDGINGLLDSEMKELSRRKDREHYFELVAIQQKFSTRLNYDESVKSLKNYEANT